MMSFQFQCKDSHYNNKLDGIVVEKDFTTTLAVFEPSPLSFFLSVKMSFILEEVK